MAVAAYDETDRVSSSPDPLNSEADYPLSLTTTTPARRALRGHHRKPTDSAAAPAHLNPQLPASARRSAAQSARSSIARSSARSGAISPRKQTFELQVGRDISPQRLLVTVEANDFDFAGGGLHRRLFASSTPPPQPTPSKMTPVSTRSTRRVPLKGEDEVSTRIAGTPRRPRATSTASKDAGSRNTPARRQSTRQRSATPSRPTDTPMRRSTRTAKTPMRKSVMISDLASTTPDDALDLGETPLPVVPKPKPTPSRRASRAQNIQATRTPTAVIDDEFDLNEILFPVPSTKSQPDAPPQPTPADSGASAASDEPATTIDVVTTTIPIAETPQIPRRALKRSRGSGANYLDTPATKRQNTPRRPTPARQTETSNNANDKQPTTTFADLFLDSTPDRSESPAYATNAPDISALQTIAEKSHLEQQKEVHQDTAPNDDDDGDLWLDNLSDDESRFRHTSRASGAPNKRTHPEDVVSSFEQKQQSLEDGNADDDEEPLEVPQIHEEDQQQQSSMDTHFAPLHELEGSEDEYAEERNETESGKPEAAQDTQPGEENPREELPAHRESIESPEQRHLPDTRLVPGSSRHAPLRIESEAPSEPMSEAMSASSHMRHDEDFSMIFPDSLHIDTSLPLGSRQDFGETTNLAINRTLESLRRDQEHGENGRLESNASTPFRLDTVAEEPEEESHIQDLPRLSSPLIRFGGSPLLKSATKNAAAAHNITSPMLGRPLTPCQRKPPSLSRQLLTREALKIEKTPAGKIADKVKGFGTLLSSGARRKPRQSPQVQPTEYEDSFTQPSESFLQTMAPKAGEYDYLIHEESTTPQTVARPDVIDLELENETPTRVPTNMTDRTTALPHDDHHEAQVNSFTPERDPEAQNEEHASTTPNVVSEEYGRPNDKNEQKKQTPVHTGPPSVSTNAAPAANGQPTGAVAASSPAPSAAKPAERPLLSSAVRAGWALQTVTSEKSSPMNQNGLGSPFRSDSSPLANRKPSGKQSLEVPAPNPPRLFGAQAHGPVQPEGLANIPDPTSPVTYEKEDSIFKPAATTKHGDSFRRAGRVRRAASLSPSGESTTRIAPVVPILAAEEEHVADVSWTTDPSRSVQRSAPSPARFGFISDKENILHVETGADDDADLWAFEADRSPADAHIDNRAPAASKGPNKRMLPTVAEEEVGLMELPNKKMALDSRSTTARPPAATSIKATPGGGPCQNGGRIQMQGSSATNYRGSTQFRPMIGRHRGIVSQNGSGESPEVTSKTAYFQRKLEQARQEAEHQQTLQAGQNPLARGTSNDTHTSSPATPALGARVGSNERAGPGSGRIDLSTFFSSPLSLPFQSARKAATAVAAAASRRIYPGTTTTTDMQDETDTEQDRRHTDPNEDDSGPALLTSSMFPSLPQRQPKTRSSQRYQPPSRIVEVSRSSSPSAAETDEEHGDTFFDHSMAHTIDQSYLNENDQLDQGVDGNNEEHDRYVLNHSDDQPDEDEGEDANVQSDAAIASMNGEDGEEGSAKGDENGPSTPAKRPAESRPQNAHTPPQMQLSSDDISRWREETSRVMEESPNEMRPMPRPGFPHHRAMSPSKSCIRSPLKGRTPGRVVEFTSSTLSPLEQQRQRIERQKGIALEKQNLAAEQQREAEALAHFERQALEGARRERELSAASETAAPSPKRRRTVGIEPPVTLAPPVGGFVHQPIELDVGQETDPDYEYEDEDEDEDNDEDLDADSEVEAEHNLQSSDEEQGSPSVPQPNRLVDLFTPKNILAERQRAAAATYHYLEPQAPPDPSSSPSAASTASSAPTIVLPRRLHLSRREWTSDHWRHLKYLVTIRRTRLFYFNAQYARPSERARLVGETVSGAGESMLLTQEHADAVDAFMADVPGWRVRDVAKRVFAIVKTDELRQREWLRQQQTSSAPGSRREHQPETEAQGAASWWRRWVSFL
ncbi:hypothetical protein BROUX41_005383 [Berkeleyomyces rouxiae]